MPKAIKTYYCELCQGSFSKPSTLKTHMYTHNGEKPFMCDYPYCGSKFSVISNLRRHMKIHNKGHIEKARSITPQERLYYVKQLVMKTQQKQQPHEYHKQNQQNYNSSYQTNKPELSPTNFCDLYQNFISYVYYDNKVQ